MSMFVAIVMKMVSESTPPPPPPPPVSEMCMMVLLGLSMVEAAICRLPVVMRWRIFYSTQGGNSILVTHGDSDEARDIIPARAISEACFCGDRWRCGDNGGCGRRRRRSTMVWLLCFCVVVWLWARYTGKP